MAALCSHGDFAGGMAAATVQERDSNGRLPGESVPLSLAVEGVFEVGGVVGGQRSRYGIVRHGRGRSPPLGRGVVGGRGA